MPAETDARARALAHSWLSSAQDDLTVAELAWDERIAPSIAAFHAQQAAAKAIKAILVSLQEEFPPSHVIGLLVRACESVGVPVPDDVRRAGGLTRFAVRTRYPGLEAAVGRAEAADSAAIAAVVVRWAARVLEDTAGTSPAT